MPSLVIKPHQENGMHNHNQSNCDLIPTRGPGVVKFDHAPTKNVEQLVFEPPRAQLDLISRAVESYWQKQTESQFV